MVEAPAKKTPPTIAQLNTYGMNEELMRSLLIGSFNSNDLKNIQEEAEKKTFNFISFYNMKQQKKTQPGDMFDSKK